MSEEFDAMIEESTKPIRPGEIVEGTVLEIKPDRIVMNVNHKYDGVVYKSEFSSDPNVDLETAVTVGQPLDVKVLRISDNEVQLSYKRINEDKANKKVQEAFENKEVLAVKVEKVTSGGLITDFEGAKIFVPASLVSDIYEKDLSKYLDQEIDILVTEYKPRNRRVIGNRKKLVQEAKEERAKMLLETLQVNDVVDGTVKSITNFGAFVDLGGIDGLLHISEMSWGRVDNPRSVVSIGDRITVFIKNIADGKIALSCKMPDKNPWLYARDKYTPGVIVEGKVARVADFGAFIELEPGIDGLLHVSQISKKRVKKPSDVLHIGQVIDVKVIDFREDEKKISLSRKDFDDDLVPDELPEEEAAEEAQAEETQAEEAPVEETAEEAPAEEAPAEEAQAEAAEEAPAEETAEEAPAEEAQAEAAEEAPAEETQAEETQAEETPAEESAEEAPAEETAEEAQAEEIPAEETAEEAAEEATEETEKTEEA